MNGLSGDSEKLDKVVYDVLTFVFGVCRNDPVVAVLVLEECLHKLDMVSKVEGKMKDVIIAKRKK